MVAVSNAGQERDCRKAVRDLGFACYMPTYREQYVKRGRKVWAERLLFGRYFFVRYAQDWKVISRTSIRQLTGLIMSEDLQKVALAPDWEIERIRACEDSSGHVSAAMRNSFTKGQRVRAVVGVMAGVGGTYVGTGRGGCEIALLDLFGRDTNVEFAPGVLQAA